MFPAAGERRARVALMTGCAQQVLAPVDQRGHGAPADPSRGRGGGGCGCTGCCGSLTHHMGKRGRGPERQCPGQHRRPGSARARSRRVWMPSSSTRPAAAPRSRTTAYMLREDEGSAWADEGRPHRRPDQRRDRVPGTSTGPDAGRNAPAPISPWLITRLARCSTASRSANDAQGLAPRRGRFRGEGRARGASSAAVRPGPTTCIQPRLIAAELLRAKRSANIETVTQPDRDRHRKHRLHDPDRTGHRLADRAYGRAFGLGHRRAGARRNAGGVE